MKKIIFLALGFPNVEKRTNLWSDLTSEFHKQGHEVLVIAPTFDNDVPGLKMEGGVKVLRVSTFKLFDVGPVKKVVANLMLPYQYKRALKKHDIKLDFDLIIMPTPPITLAKIAKWLKRKSKSKIYLILRDIFPQNAVDLKMIKPKGIIHWYFRRKEKGLYNLSDKIGCMSNANIAYIKKNNPHLDHSKLHLLPNWEYLPKNKSEENLDNIKLKYGIDNKFVAIFGGNIGKPQKLENIITLAQACSEVEDIIFLIIGKGSEYNKISKMVDSLSLSNVKMWPRILKKDYDELLKTADLGLISLDENFSIPNFPSKVLSYFAAKIPVLGSLDLQTDFGEMLIESNSGFWAEAGKTELLKEKLLTLYNSKDLREEMGRNGYNYMTDNLLPDHACKTILTHV